MAKIDYTPKDDFERELQKKYGLEIAQIQITHFDRLNHESAHAYVAVVQRWHKAVNKHRNELFSKRMFRRMVLLNNIGELVGKIIRMDVGEKLTLFELVERVLDDNLDDRNYTITENEVRLVKRRIG